MNIYKGTKTDIDSYSAFYDNMKLSQTALQDELQRRNVTDVYVCGLAYDVCVGRWTALRADRVAECCKLLENRSWQTLSGE